MLLGSDCAGSIMVVLSTVPNAQRERENLSLSFRTLLVAPGDNFFFRGRKFPNDRLQVHTRIDGIGGLK